MAIPRNLANFATQLDVSGFKLGSASTPSVTFTGDTNTGIFSSAADTLNFTTGGSERVRISSTGTLGLNNTNPSASSQYFTFTGNGYGGGNGSGVNGSPTAQVLWTGFGLDNSGSVNPVGFQLLGGGGGVPRGLIMASYGSGRSTTRDSVFFTTNTGNSVHNTGLGLPTAGVYRGAVDATTFAPASWSTFVGNGGMTSFGIYDNAQSDYDGTSKCGIQVQLAGTYGGGSPGAWGGTCYTAQITTNFGSGSAGTNIGFRANITNAGSGTNWGIYIDNGNAAKPGGGSWTATSDARVKNVTGQYELGLSQVVQINPVKYTYNGKGGHASDGKELVGVIAQEIQLLFPEMVSTRLGKLNENDQEDTEILMVDNSSLVYALVNCVKELNAKIANLEAKLEAK